MIKDRLPKGYSWEVLDREDRLEKRIGKEER